MFYKLNPNDKNATQFVHQYSDYSYVHIKQSLTSIESLQVKQSFEYHFRKMNVIVQKYHANNRGFFGIEFI